MVRHEVWTSGFRKGTIIDDDLHTGKMKLNSYPNKMGVIYLPATIYGLKSQGSRQNKDFCNTLSTIGNLEFRIDN